jgi:hypothetical protein
MITSIDESIKVGAIFGNGRKIKPVWFLWNRRRYPIREVTYSWVSREGRATIYNFSVTDGSSLYEICYNAETLSWKLLAVETE